MFQRQLAKLLTLLFDGRTASYRGALDYQAAGEGHELLYTEKQGLRNTIHHVCCPVSHCSDLWV